MAMALRLVSASERLSDAYNKTTGVIFGRAKVGKTTLAATLPDNWLFTDMEAGMKSLSKSNINSVPINSFDDAINLACIIGGPDLSLSSGMFSQGHYNNVMSVYGNMGFQNFRGSYWDSITDLTRLALVWAGQQPEGYTAKGVADMRAQYGLIGRYVIKLLKHVQRTPGKDCFFVGGLDHYWSEGREIFEAQTEGNKVAAELPFIVDQIITMSDFDFSGGQFVHNIGKGKHRALCCKSPNPWGLPAGDRSGRLDLIEPPHLGKLLAKINAR